MYIESRGKKTHGNVYPTVYATLHFFDGRLTMTQLAVLENCRFFLLLVSSEMTLLSVTVKEPEKQKV